MSQFILFRTVTSAFSGLSSYGVNTAAVTANEGGLVPGGPGGRGPDADSVPAVLTPGEYVMRRTAADYYGPVLEALNRRLIPRSLFAGVPKVGSPTQAVTQAFNGGGKVAAGGVEGQSAPQVLPVMVTDPADLERLFASGRQGLLRVMREHASEFRGAIG